MKKFLISTLVVLSGLCVYAAGWERISDKIYLDMSGISAAQKAGEYSFWTKELNDGGSDFVLAEQKYSQKIWYDLVRYSLDCSGRRFKIEEILIYGLQNNLIATDSSHIAVWHSIPPQSFAEDYMKLVCTYKPEPKISEPAPAVKSEQKTPTPGPLTFTEVKPDAPLIRMEVIKPKK